MAFTPDYDDIDFGDETRGEAVQTVSLPHDEATDGIPEGKVVGWDDGAEKIVPADAGTVDPIGVLYTYQYYTDNTGGSKVRQDRKATIAVGGKLKVYAESSATAGPVTADSTSGSAGNLNSADADATANFIAVSDATEQGSSGDYYVEAVIN